VYSLPVFHGDFNQFAASQVVEHQLPSSQQCCVTFESESFLFAFQTFDSLFECGSDVLVGISLVPQQVQIPILAESGQPTSCRQSLLSPI
jgi:hypothetical protein